LIFEISSVAELRNVSAQPAANLGRLAYHLAALDPFSLLAPLFDRRNERAASRFLFGPAIRLQIRSISALSSGLCFPLFVAIKSASLAAG
jgi:hypothetical protein